MVPCRLGGSNSPRLRSFSHASRTAACAAGVRVVIMSSVNTWRVNGGGSVGSTCVADARSPGTSEAGTFTSCIGKTGVPVSRSRTYVHPFLAICATTSIRAPVPRNRHERRRRREVAIPDVVLHALEVPHAFTGCRAEAEDGVREQVVAVPVAAVEIVGGGSRRGEDETALLVEGDAGPGVGAAGVFPGVLRPRLVAELAGVRDGVERPLLPAGVDVERADVTRRRGQPFRHDRSDNQEVAVEHAGRVDADVERARIASGEALAQIDAAVLSEPRHRLTRVRVERVEPVPGAEVDAASRRRAPSTSTRGCASAMGFFASVFGSKLHFIVPVAASSAKTRSFGEVA